MERDATAIRQLMQQLRDLCTSQAVLVQACCDEIAASKSDTVGHMLDTCELLLAFAHFKGAFNRDEWMSKVVPALATAVLAGGTSCHEKGLQLIRSMSQQAAASVVPAPSAPAPPAPAPPAPAPAPPPASPAPAPPAPAPAPSAPAPCTASPLAGIVAWDFVLQACNKKRIVDITLADNAAILQAVNQLHATSVVHRASSASQASEYTHPSDTVILWAMRTGRMDIASAFQRRLQQQGLDEACRASGCASAYKSIGRLL